MKKYIITDRNQQTIDPSASETRMQILGEIDELEKVLTENLALLQKELNSPDSAFVQAELERRKQFMLVLRRKEQRYY